MEIRTGPYASPLRSAWCGSGSTHQANVSLDPKASGIVITAIVIPVDPAQPIRQQQLDNSDLDAYRQIVGGNIEAINLIEPPATLYLNEEGKLDGLAFNHRATALLWVHNSAYRGEDVVVHRH